MNILEELVKIANILDQKGRFDEAAEIDDVIAKLADNSWPKHDPRGVSKYRPSEKEVGVITPSQNMQNYIAGLKLLRKQLGLPEHPRSGRNLFDKELAHMLQTQYPGVWKPKTNQKLSDIFKGIEDHDTAVAGKGKQQAQVSPQIGHGDAIGKSVTIPALETATNPPVELGPKTEIKI